MQNYKPSEKSKGILVFAFNNADTDYIKITEHFVRLARHTLNLPITLVTGQQETINFEVDQLIRVDTSNGNSRKEVGTGRRIEWRNFGRYYAYDLSPYDETLVLDTDYLVLDDQLLTYFDTAWDYLIPDRNMYLGQEATVETMGRYSLPYIWATNIFFRKTPKTQMLFELVGKVQRNYFYYKSLYNTSVSNFRNDYAFAIADYIVNGYTSNIRTHLNRTLITADQPVMSLDLVDNMLHIRGTETAYVLPVLNLHILDKRYLQSKNFADFVEKFCNEK